VTYKVALKDSLEQFHESTISNSHSWLNRFLCAAGGATLGVLAIGIGLSFSDATKREGATISFLSGTSLAFIGASVFYAKQRDPYDRPSKSLDGVELVIEPEGLERFEIPNQAYEQNQTTPQYLPELPEIETPSFDGIFQAAPPTLVAVPRPQAQHQPQPQSLEDSIPQHIRDFAS
jgi:hypothetical protein